MMSNYPSGMRECDIPGIDDRDISVSFWIRIEMDVSISNTRDPDEIDRQIKEQIKEEYPDTLEIQDIEILS